MEWTVNAAAGAECLGIIPLFLDPADTRPAAEQIHEAYAHGGGWHSFYGFTLARPNPDPLTWALEYSGDRPMEALAWTQLRDEFIVLFECAWVAVVQPDGTFDVARID